jgi:hypothetical protein
MFTTPAWHHVERYANNPIEADHGQLSAGSERCRDLPSDQTQVVIAEHTLLPSTGVDLIFLTPLGFAQVTESFGSKSSTFRSRGPAEPASAKYATGGTA